MKIDENDFFRQVTKRVCSHLDIEKSMHSCLEYLLPLMPAQSMYLQLFEKDFGAMRIIAKATVSEGEKLDILIPLSNIDRTAIDQWRPKIEIVNDPETTLVGKTMTRALGLEDSSLLIMPLMIEEMVLGHLVLTAKGKGRYSEEHEKLFSLLNESFVIAMSNTLKHQEVIKLKEMLDDDNRYLHQELKRISGAKIIGEDFGLKNIMELVRQVAALDSPVLLLGETGVGKDVIANAIHYSSPRRNGPFIKVNSGAIPETLMDSELFGHEKGAFTGALSQKRGRFERAHKGTIFLDEIAELPQQAQVRMLRVLQAKEIERVGGSTPITVDIRIIAATHRNLEEMIKSERFREDLWFRLNVFPIMIPPLRQRKEDIPALVYYFIERKSMDMKLPSTPRFATGAIDRLMAYNWPGNVRELENVIERALILNRKGPIDFDRFILKQKDDKIQVLKSKEEGFQELEDLMSLHIQKALTKTNGRIHGPKGAAKLLGINPSTLRSRIKKLGIK
jgi:transcriptional regulator with GAF, ATPase, and Fis domain